MLEDHAITERLVRLETQQGNIQGGMERLETAMSELVKSFNAFISVQGKVDARLFAIEQDLRDGRTRFKAHDEDIATIRRRCDESKWIRDAGARHLEEAKGQDLAVHGAILTSGWAERSVWILVAGVLALVAYLRG